MAVSLSDFSKKLLMFSANTGAARQKSKRADQSRIVVTQFGRHILRRERETGQLHDFAAMAFFGS